jgi:CRISPR/Cas system endoribonuclease Cas6 (RAMP superfamily)
VFRAPQITQTRFEKGEPFDFDVVLIGRALDFLPYFVLSFRELAVGGLGLNRAKCNLERVEQITPRSAGPVASDRVLVYAAEHQLFRATEATTADEWIKARVETQHAESSPVTSSKQLPALRAVQRITIRFVTPTLLRVNGEITHRPDFHHVFKRLRDRVNALSTFFGDGPLEADFSELGKRAEKVRTAGCHVEWAERFRTSSKTRQRHQLSGFVGETVYEGEFSEFLPWLAVGELVHIGKHAAWGNGWVEVNPDSNE